jgi:hypothetical protein
MLQGQPLHASQLPVHSTPMPSTPQERLQQVEESVRCNLRSLQLKQEENDAVRACIAEELGQPDGVGEERQRDLEHTLQLIASFERDVPRARSLLAHWVQQSGAEAGMGSMVHV